MIYMLSYCRICMHIKFTPFSLLLCCLLLHHYIPHSKVFYRWWASFVAYIHNCVCAFTWINTAFCEDGDDVRVKHRQTIKVHFELMLFLSNSMYRTYLNTFKLVGIKWWWDKERILWFFVVSEWKSTAECSALLSIGFGFFSHIIMRSQSTMRKEQKYTYLFARDEWIGECG